MISRDRLVHTCHELLKADAFKDYTLNGLQVAGSETVGKVMTGVTACQALLDEAVAWGADLVLVHHGYFWKNEPVAIAGMKRRRLGTLMAHDINLLAYHLPLDAHAALGNNARLATELGFTVEGCVDGEMGEGLIWLGAPHAPMNNTELGHHLAQRLKREPVVIAGHDRPIERIAWCTGGAQDMIIQACEAGADAFISGEISERTTHLAREMGISYYAAGHHATERYGVQALGEWLASEFEIEHRFVDIDNPA
ncbi:Nif3-like dinuclear metal center hexameric protein [Modicisalibacter luteus]|uniref:Nif3-like dinuclear metal center hexameric protein n=1 Tax=Modicisalibacter luteus TaxID=453962 RepID=A0ABV7M1T1_9GAMM|nr:Nif3-like dinuclear metal center hexameric protein [Halomonas lutea]GHA91135.1 GTP cyclohydrolase 1 type 2 [Halomonas lutea]